MGLMGRSERISDHGSVSERTPQRPAERVEAELRARINANEWAPGQQLPPIATLAKDHHTSRTTAQRAIARLADEGLLVVVRAWGTFRAEG
jgi:DNA-binding GntR family transcriptional regulator